MIMWRKAEEVAGKQLEAEFGERFTPKSIPVGSKPRRFDFVSDKATVVAQVKSCTKKLEQLTRPQLDTRFQRDYIFDCLLLTRVPAERRLFFLAADRALFDKFVGWSSGRRPVPPPDALRVLGADR